MTLHKFQRILGAVSKVCDGEKCDLKRKQMIENGLIELWNDYRELEDATKEEA